MKKIDGLLRKIEELREEMNCIIDRKDTLLDSEIINISKCLDEQLVEYYRILKNKKAE